MAGLWHLHRFELRIPVSQIDSLLRGQCRIFTGLPLQQMPKIKAPPFGAYKNPVVRERQTFAADPQTTVRDHQTTVFKARISKNRRNSHLSGCRISVAERSDAENLGDVCLA